MYSEETRFRLGRNPCTDRFRPSVSDGLKTTHAYADTQKKKAHVKPTQDTHRHTHTHTLTHMHTQHPHHAPYLQHTAPHSATGNYNTLQRTLQPAVTRCKTLQCTLQHSATHVNTLQRTLQHTATHGNTHFKCCQSVWHTLTTYKTLRGDCKAHRNKLYHTATHCNGHCNTRQHTATHCLRKLQHSAQHTAHHCNTLYSTGTHWKAPTSHTATIRNTLQHTLQHTATHGNTLCCTLQHTVTHYNTLQHTSTHRNTLQHTATHCPRRRPEKKNYYLCRFVTVCTVKRMWSGGYVANVLMGDKFHLQWQVLPDKIVNLTSLTWQVDLSPCHLALLLLFKSLDRL